VIILEDSEEYFPEISSMLCTEDDNKRMNEVNCHKNYVNDLSLYRPTLSCMFESIQLNGYVLLKLSCEIKFN